MADAELLPYDFNDFTETVRRYINEVEKLAGDMREQIVERNRRISEGLFAAINDPREPLAPPPAEAAPPVLNFAPLENGFNALQRTAEQYNQALAHASENGGSALVRATLRDANRKLIAVEPRLEYAAVYTAAEMLDERAEQPMIGLTDQLLRSDQNTGVDQRRERPSARRVLVKERDNPAILLVHMLGTSPLVQHLDTRQQLCQLRGGGRWMRFVVARQQECRHRTAPHEIAADAEHEFAAPHVVPECAHRRLVQLRAFGALLLHPLDEAFREVFREFRMQSDRILQHSGRDPRSASELRVAIGMGIQTAQSSARRGKKLSQRFRAARLGLEKRNRPMSLGAPRGVLQ